MPADLDQPQQHAGGPSVSVLVTGAGGFLGSSLIPLLVRRNHRVVRWPSAERDFDFNSIETHPRWVETLRGVDVVVHLAAHVHRRATTSNDDLRFQSINCEGSLRLARAAIEAGVKRFVFVSTAKVFGEGKNRPYDENSEAAPQDAYARSKWEAEQGLRQLIANTTLELVVIRPPLVYGPKAGANFARLQQLARLPLPLPLKNINNRRDMIGIDNLIDFIGLCVRAPAAAGGTWLCSDGSPYSLAQVVSALRSARGKRPLLFYLPKRWVISIVEMVVGSANSRRLFDNFEVNIEATRTRLRWSPPYRMMDIMQTTAVDGS